VPIFSNEEFNRNFKGNVSSEKPVSGTNQFIMQPQGYMPRNNYFPQPGNKGNITKSMKIFKFI